jgi:predicted HicB family RNase H-like nuclease
MKTDEKRFSATLVVRHPPRLSPLIDRAAERRCMTASEYVRQSIRTAKGRWT